MITDKRKLDMILKMVSGLAKTLTERDPNEVWLELAETGNFDDCIEGGIEIGHQRMSRDILTVIKGDLGDLRSIKIDYNLKG